MVARLDARANRGIEADGPVVASVEPEVHEPQVVDQVAAADHQHPGFPQRPQLLRELVVPGGRLPRV